MREEFEKWWHGDDTSRHPTNRYEGAMRWAYEGWVRGVAAEREACAKAVGRARLQIDGAFGVTHQTDFIATHITDFYVATIRARGDQ